MKIISGGQTGADQAGLRAAKRFGLETGGWAPVGWLTENGATPRLAEFGLRECETPDYERPAGMPQWKYDAICYVARTKANARDSEATVWFGRGDSRGFDCTANACNKPHRPLLTVLSPGRRPVDSATWIRGFGVQVLNVAGNRESKAPGIGKWVEEYLCEVFRLLGFEEIPA